MLRVWTFASSGLASFRASSTANSRMYAVTERPAARAWRDNRSTSRAMPSAFVAGSCRQNSTSLAMIPTHATNTRPTQIHTKQANQSNAYGASIGRHKLLPHGGRVFRFSFSVSPRPPRSTSPSYRGLFAAPSSFLPSQKLRKFRGLTPEKMNAFGPLSSPRVRLFVSYAAFATRAAHRVLLGVVRNRHRCSSHDCAQR